MPDSPSLLQRLKERKLVQWAVAYLAGAFVVFQSVEVMAEPWGISPALQRAVHIVLVIGLFIALVLAWYHSEKGRQRVSGPELLMVAALLVVAGVALTLLRPQEGTFAPIALEGDDRPGIAVFPCENWSPDPEDAYFARGIHDEILLRLSRISGLRSVGRESMEWYDERSLPTRQVAQELGVGYLGECSVLKDAERNQIRLTFQLIDGSTGTQIWAENYDEDLTARSIFDIHTDLAGQVARQVGARLTPVEQERLAKRPTESSEAYDLYLRGRDLWWTRGPGALEQAIEVFEAAIAEDPDFALAYAGLAETYAVLPEHTSRSSAKILPLARAAADRALSLAPDLAEAHTASGYIHAVFEWDWEAAERDYVSAIELNPDYATAHQWYAEMLAMNGRWDEAFAEINVAVALDPRSPAANNVMGVMLSLTGKPHEGIQRIQRALAINPELVGPGWSFGYSYLEMGDYVEAASWFDSAASQIGQDPEVHRAVLAALSDSTKIPEAVRAVRETPDFWPSGKAMLMAYLGQAEEAIAALEQAVEEHAPMPLLIWPKVSPAYEEIRSHPRFQALLRRMNLIE